jgi:hypothetical protein
MSTIAPARLAARFERDIVKIFRRHWATNAAAARRLRDMGLKDTDVLQGLVAATILRRAGPERYFLHEETWAARSHMSWHTVQRLAILVALIGLAAALYWYRSSAG